MKNKTERRKRIYQLAKVAGKKEKGKAGGLNFGIAKKNLIDGGLNGDIPREEIDKEIFRLKESGVAIKDEVLGWIDRINLTSSPAATNELEKFVIITGACLSSDSEEEALKKIDKISSYIMIAGNNAGYFKNKHGIKEDIVSSKEILDYFNSIYEEVSKSQNSSEVSSEQASSTSSGKEYISNEVVYNFSDGWRVVYIPAAGESGMPEFPGLPGTSHDRILEGNKNGLCIGSSSKKNQDNEEGKIYSIRDLGNNPMVTIRIKDGELKEAKGKNNNTPDVQGTVHAKELFQNMEGLKYEESGDFLRFPPIDSDKVIKAFSEDKDSPYKNGWIYAWYDSGIQSLDKDVIERIKNNDPLVFQSGLGKVRFELVKPVVSYWCQMYLSNRASSGVLFGGKDLPEPIHEVYKTYRKLPEMVAAVKKFSTEDPTRFIHLLLHEQPEYKDFSKYPKDHYVRFHPENILEIFSEKDWAKEPMDGKDGLSYRDLASKTLAENKPVDFIDKFSDRLSKEEWGKGYLDIAASRLIQQDPGSLIKYRDRDWAKKYLDTAAKAYAEYNPMGLIQYHGNKEWANNAMIIAGKKIAKSEPAGFIYKFANEKWAKEPADELNGKSYLDVAIEECFNFEDYEYDFLFHGLFDEDWAEPYIRTIAKEHILKYIEKNFRNFMQFAGNKWAKKERDELNGNSYQFLAVEKYYNEDKDSILHTNGYKEWMREPKNELSGKSFLGYIAGYYAMRDPYNFIKNFSNDSWAAEVMSELGGISFLKLAINYALFYPQKFITEFGEEYWATRPITEFGGKSYIDFAKEKINIPPVPPAMRMPPPPPITEINQNASQANVKLLKLAGAIKKMSAGNISQEIVELKKLASRI